MISENNNQLSHAKVSLYKLWERYGTLGFIRLSIDYVYSRLRFPGARLVRRPIYVRGRDYISLGCGFTSGVGLRLDAFPKQTNKRIICLEIGDNVQVNDYVHIAAVQSVRIGNHVLIGSKVFISDHNHGCYKGEVQSNPEQPPALRLLYTAPVVIEDNVWIGESVCILPGVTIGRGAVIGALSVVTSDIPPNCIAAGSPAVVIRKYRRESAKWEPA
jgi:lipopolysaccharide O-acetyltransferase